MNYGCAHRNSLLSLSFGLLPIRLICLLAFIFFRQWCIICIDSPIIDEGSAAKYTSFNCMTQANAEEPLSLERLVILTPSFTFGCYSCMGACLLTN